MLYDPKWQAKEFLSATALRIPEDWRGALIKTLDLMEAGKIPHVSTAVLDSSAAPEFRYFNMTMWVCGTVGCIGGTAEEVGGIRFQPRKKFTPEMFELFHPRCGNWDHIKDGHAAQALRNYLTFGRPSWESVLPFAYG
jgi:hypothetical protein